jgi:hypothetical protein
MSDSEAEDDPTARVRQLSYPILPFTVSVSPLSHRLSSLRDLSGKEMDRPNRVP